MTDWELWACANMMRERHGEDAAIHAAQRADALLAQGDQLGTAVWLRIVERIGSLGPDRAAGATEH